MNSALTEHDRIIIGSRYFFSNVLAGFKQLITFSQVPKDKYELLTLMYIHSSTF